MRFDPKSTKIISFLLLALFFLTAAVFAFKGYYAGIGSDPYGIIHFARHLARGNLNSDFPVYDWIKGGKDRWGPDESFFVLHGNYILTGGTLSCKYTIGFPLVLALSIRLFGADSVFWVNIFILLLLLWVYYLLARQIFSEWKYGLQLSVLCPILLVVTIDRIWNLSLRPSRDLSALLFVITGVYFSVRTFRRPRRLGFGSLAAGAFCLGFSASIRLPNILVGLPGGIFLLSRLIGRVRWKKFFPLLAAAVFFFALGVGPALFQNYRATGDPLKPPRPEIVERNPLKVQGEPTPPPLWLGFFKTTAPETAAYFWSLYGPFFTILIVLGFISSWRRPEILFLVAGIPVVFICFYSMWVHLMIRYMIIAQPFLILLLVTGIGRLLKNEKKIWIFIAGLLLLIGDGWLRWKGGGRFGLDGLHPYLFFMAVVTWICAGWKLKKWPSAARVTVLILVALGLFIARYGYTVLASDELFQLPEARRLGGDIDRVTEKDSVIFATKPAANYIALFSDSYSIRPFEMKRVGVDPVEGIRRLLDRGTGVYLIDSSGWKRDATKALPGLRRYFDVRVAGTIPVEEYFLEANFGKPVATVYRIRERTHREVTVRIPVPEGKGDCLLTLNPGEIYPPGQTRRPVTVELNGEVLEPEPGNDISFLRVSRAILRSPDSTLTLTGDALLPVEIDFRIQPVSEDYRVNLADQLAFPDKRDPDGFAESRLRDADLVRLGWETPGLVAIPTVAIPGTGLMGEITLNNDGNYPSPVPLIIRLNGRQITRFNLESGRGWRTIQFLLPEKCYDAVISELELEALRPPDHRLSTAEERVGALLVKDIWIRRKKKEVELAPLDPNDYYFCYFRFRPSRPEEECPGPFRITVNDRVIRSGIVPGGERIILEPDDLGPGINRLGVEGSGPGCEGLFLFEPLFFPLAASWSVNIGGEKDDAYLIGGFYGREKHLGTIPVRWTKERARLLLPLPGAGVERRFGFTIAAAGPPRRSGETGVKIYLEGELIGTIPLEEGGGEYDIIVPARSGGSEAFKLRELELAVPTWSPRVYRRSGDGRNLGVMLERVTVDYQ